MINARIVAAVSVAVVTGLAIALQAAFNGRAGGVIGPIRTGLLVNASGGAIAATVTAIAILIGRFGIGASVVLQRSVMLPVIGAGILGIIIIIGISYSVANIGVTAGLAAVMISQLVAGMVLDQSAIGAGVAIGPRRILGVLAMAAGVWLLLPRPA
jgi:uncharacterized membrane protein YdcZ (DUF606 family)